MSDEKRTQRAMHFWRHQAPGKVDFTIETDKPSPVSILLSGEMDGKKIRARLRKLDLNNFLLNSRGFQWISEFPFNR